MPPQVLTIIKDGSGKYSREFADKDADEIFEEIWGDEDKFTVSMVGCIGAYPLQLVSQ